MGGGGVLFGGGGRGCCSGARSTTSFIFFDFSQFRLRPISTSANLISASWPKSSILVLDAAPCATAPQPRWWNDECCHALVCRNGAWRDYRRLGLSTDYARFSQRRLVFHRVIRRARRGFWSDWQEQVEGLRRPDPRVCANQIRRVFPASRALVFHTNNGLERELNSIKRAGSSR